MNFLNIVTKEYPLHQGDLELLGWKVGEPLPENWVEVIETEMPSRSENQVIVQKEPQKINGQWMQVWEVKTLTTQEIEEIRKSEEELLLKIKAFIE